MYTSVNMSNKLEHSRSSSEHDVSSSEDDLSSTDDVDFSGELIGNKYILLEKVGRGSYSTVWMAYNRISKKFYAIKIQNSRDYEDGLEEVSIYRTLGSKKCEYMNQLLESFTLKFNDGTHICMVFELMAGSIYDVMKKGTYANGLPLETTRVIIYQLLSAINFLGTQFGKIHPDIKPENILLVGTNKKYKYIINQFEQSYKKYTSSKKYKSNDTRSQQLAFKKIISEIKYPENNSNDSSKECLIDEETVNPSKLVIKLTDFTGCKELDKNKHDIQLTRYYRAPEMLLYYPFDEKCQIWSIACLFYELVTGEILFDPSKEKGFSTDRYHFYEMQSRLGKIPKELIVQSKRRSYFFRNNDTLKGRFDAHYDALYESVIKKLSGRPDINKEEILSIVDFLYRALQWDPFKRPSAKECLEHPLFAPKKITQTKLL